MTDSNLPPFVKFRNPFNTRSARAWGTGSVSHYNNEREEYGAEEFTTIDNPECCPAGSTKMGVTIPVATLARVLA